MDSFTFTLKDLIEIREGAFGTKTTCSDIIASEAATVSDQVFSVSNIQQLENIERENLDTIFIKSSYGNEWFWKEINEELIIAPARKHLITQAWLNRKPCKSDLDITTAKRFPIHNLITFNRARKARCIFHDDHSPSMQYYPRTNTVYCWSCKEWGDSIKVYQKLYNKTFKESVRALQ